jgi:uncharacterized protein
MHLIFRKWHFKPFRLKIMVLGLIVSINSCRNNNSVKDDEKQVHRSVLCNLSHNAEIIDSIYKKVYSTSLIDVHEHLMDEKDRLGNPSLIDGKSNDWTLLLGTYIDSDLLCAGMTQNEYKLFFTSHLPPIEKWKILEPYWTKVKFTGYSKAFLVSIKELYGIDELSSSTVEKLQKEYFNTIRPGFYKRILQGKANMESCQVNDYPVLKSEIPEFLMTDLFVDWMIDYKNDSEAYAKEIGIDLQNLNDWEKVIDWYFRKYGQYVVALKLTLAYDRNIDFSRTAFNVADPIFKKYIQKNTVSKDELKSLQDYLFWYVVEKSNEYKLPVKMHLGYHASWEGKKTQMQLAMVGNNAKDACYLCSESKDTRFVFLHIDYPYYEEMLAVAKQYPNAYIDMSWVWIINPVAAKDFLKKFIVTVPINKILVFGGDSRMAELVVGHSIIARNGITQVLSDLVKEKYITTKEAIEMVDFLSNLNAREIFRLEDKKKILKGLDWNKI